MKRAFILAGALIALAVVHCETYETPPRPVVEGLVGGSLADARAPIVVDFGTPVDPNTVAARLIYAETDDEGNLFDEDADEATTPRILLSRETVAENVGGGGTVDEDGRRLRLTPTTTLPVGPQLFLVIDGGVTSLSGRVMKNRARIPLSFQVNCAGGGGTTMESGVYFVALDVAEPLGTQLQVFAAFDVDQTTGRFVAQFTNGDRNPDDNRCSPPCDATTACRTLPGPPRCVAPSEKVVSTTEYPDFVPNFTPPTGYSFTVQGCAVDNGPDSAGVATAPARMVVQSPAVIVEGLTLTGEFKKDGTATGSLAADLVLLGTNPLGAGKGVMSATLIPADKALPEIPRPPPVDRNARDGGRTPP